MAPKNKAAVHLGRKGGRAQAAKLAAQYTPAQLSKAMRKLSNKRMEKLTPEQRSAIAKKAVDAREARKVRPPTQPA